MIELPQILTTYGDDLLDGLLITVQLVAIAIAAGAVLATVVVRARMSERWWLRWLSWFYVNLFRGSPLLAQLFLIYYGLGYAGRGTWESVGLWWLFREPFNMVVVAFTLNTAAYQAEIFRGALLAIPAGQREAAGALGLSPRQTFRKVVFPQASLYALRPFGNEIILMIKGSAVASVVTVYDLLGETRVAYSDTLRFDIYFYAAALYLILVEVLRQVWNVLERRLTRHLAAPTAADT